MLYIFNPDHDMALARSEVRYDIPLLAKKFAEDCAALPLWYAERGARVLAPGCESWADDLKAVFPQLQEMQIEEKFSCDEELSPWGWNVHLCRMAHTDGACHLPTDTFLENVKKYSHRNFAAQCLSFLKNNCTYKLPEVPIECFSQSEVEECLQHQMPQIYKAPWSGSGKGLFRLLDSVPDSFMGWVKNVIRLQGSVMAEHYYERIQDFAMEFLCRDGKVSFEGYSLFVTSTRCAYMYNELLTNEEIEKRLSTYVPEYMLLEVQKKLTAFLQQNMSASYNGYVGVDMFVYKKDGEYQLHPCVEINVRMTMGAVARIFYDRFVQPGKKGKYEVKYFSRPIELNEYHSFMEKQYPLRTEKGLVNEGYLSLCPIGENTNYLISISIEH